MNQRIMKVTVPGKPLPLNRPRFRRRGKFVQCYNSQTEEENNFKNAVKNALSDEENAFLVDLMKSKKTYYVTLGCIFYVPIQSGTSKKMREKKLNNEVRPDKRPDIDNYIKFVLDAIHNVIYTDDACVTEITNTSKRYGEEPRTELTITIEY